MASPSLMTRSAGLSACLIAFFFVCSVLLAPGTRLHAEQPDTPRQTVTLVTSTGTYDFKVEVAETREQHSRGLMFRGDLGPREGMIFLYSEPQYVSMWMRNTYITLDMIFIKADGRVHRIETMTEPLSERIIESGDKILGVLEIPGGVASEVGLKPGDLVRHPHFTSP